MKDMEVIFYAPLGRNISSEKIGGAEAGCRKTLHIYQSNGITVHCIEKAVNKGNLPLFLISILSAYISLIWKCMLHRKALVHIVGFYGKIINIEWLLVKTSKLLGHKTIYEMRNGGMVNIFNRSDDKYKQRQIDIWRIAEGLLCQGQKFVDFIKATIDKDSFYYPNFIPKHSTDHLNRDTVGKELNLIFFGRLVESKNIDVILHIAFILYSNNQNIRLNLIGGIAPEYKEKLDTIIAELNLPEGIVRFHGHQNFEYIGKCLQNSHFFVFPSAEPNEGHSNSLTEAMGYGVVPIASTAGFNESICNDPNLIVASLSAEEYASRISQLSNPDTWLEKSIQVEDRITNNFTEEIVSERLIAYIRKIYNS